MFYNPSRILNGQKCIYSCLQIPPRENWFQSVRRVYATAINFPCIITLVPIMCCINFTFSLCLISWSVEGGGSCYSTFISLERDNSYRFAFYSPSMCTAFKSCSSCLKLCPVFGQGLEEPKGMFRVSHYF